MDFEDQLIETLKSLSLSESSLSRVWRHTNNPERSFAILTAFRKEYTREENVKRNLSLAASVSRLGYGYFYLDGYSVEDQGKPTEKRVKEDSIFVVGPEGKSKSDQMLSDMKRLAKEFDQDWVLFKPAGSTKAYGHTSGSVIELGEFHPDKIAVAYSRLSNGRTFVFESAREGLGWISRLVRSKLTKL